MAQPKKRNTDNNTAPLLLIVAGFILILIVLIWQIFLSLTKDYYRSDNEPTKTSDALYPNILRSSLEDIFTTFEDERIVFSEITQSNSTDWLILNQVFAKGLNAVSVITSTEFARNEPSLIG